MKFFMIPKEEKFFEMFIEASTVILDGARIFKDLVDNFTDVETKVQKLSEIEKVADGYTHRMVDAINRSFITPIDRDDIYQINGTLDDILDYIEACAVRLQLFKIKQTDEGMKQFAALILNAVENIHDALVDFPKPEKIMAVTKEIKRIESEGDTLSHKLISDLFDREKDPIELIKLKEIYGRLESTLDRCQDLACLLEAVVVKNG